MMMWIHKGVLSSNIDFSHRDIISQTSPECQLSRILAVKPSVRFGYLQTFDTMPQSGQWTLIFTYNAG